MYCCGAGAIATGSHGSSIHHGTLADSVVGLILVTGDGKRLELREESDILKAARSSLGRIGLCDVSPRSIGVVCLSLVDWPHFRCCDPN